MQSEATDRRSESSHLSDADYDRLYEYRLAPRNQDLRKTYKRHRSIKRKGSASKQDPTGNHAVNRVMYSSKSKGY